MNIAALSGSYILYQKSATETNLARVERFWSSNSQVVYAYIRILEWSTARDTAKWAEKDHMVELNSKKITEYRPDPENNPELYLAIIEANLLE